MSTTAARLFLLQGIRSYFQANGVTTAVFFGFKERTKSVNQGKGGANRIVVIPGRFPNHEDGELVAPTGTGGNPRRLMSQELITTLSLWAVAADNGNEEQTEQAIDDMKENVISAIQSTLMHAVQWGANRYNPEPIETRFGVEYLIEISISGLYHALEQGILTEGVTPKIDRGRETYPLP